MATMMVVMSAVWMMAVLLVEMAVFLVEMAVLLVEMGTLGHTASYPSYPCQRSDP